VFDSLKVQVHVLDSPQFPFALCIMCCSETQPCKTEIEYHTKGIT
jgi:hypothetical protein